MKERMRNWRKWQKGLFLLGFVLLLNTALFALLEVSGVAWQTLTWGDMVSRW